MGSLIEELRRRETAARAEVERLRGMIPPQGTAVLAAQHLVLMAQHE